MQFLRRLDPPFFVYLSQALNHFYTEELRWKLRARIWGSEAIFLPRHFRPFSLSLLLITGLLLIEVEIRRGRRYFYPLLCFFLVTILIAGLLFFSVEKWWEKRNSSIYSLKKGFFVRKTMGTPPHIFLLFKARLEIILIFKKGFWRGFRGGYGSRALFFTLSHLKGWFFPFISGLLLLSWVANGRDPLYQKGYFLFEKEGFFIPILFCSDSIKKLLCLVQKKNLGGGN